MNNKAKILVNRCVHSFLLTVLFFLTFVSNSMAAELAKSKKKHCQPDDIKCLQARSDSGIYAPKEGRTYDDAGRLRSETIGDTTTYYTYDENGKQKQHYKEKIVTEKK